MSLRKIGFIVAAWLFALPYYGLAQDQTVIGEEEIKYLVYPISGVNTKLREYGPQMAGKYLYFTSSREPNQLARGENNWSRAGYTSVYRGVIVIAKDTVVVNKVGRLPSTFNTVEDSGPIHFSRDGKDVFITKLDYSTEPVLPKIYRVNNANAKQFEWVRLPNQSDQHKYGHAALSPDGTRLYFSSDAPNGGGANMNIWYMDRTDSNGWSAPNPVTSINTIGAEVSPFVTETHLYYASNGPGGNGGMDMYKCEITDSGFGSPENLGTPINSSADDYGFALSSTSEFGFLSSTREEGKGLDDIYFFKMVRTYKVQMDSDQIAGSFKFRTLEGENVAGVEVLLLDSAGNVIMRTKTDSEGAFLFKELDKDKDYMLALSEAEEVNLVLGEGETLEGSFSYRTLNKEKAEGLLVALVDDAGNVVFAMTDRKSVV